MLFKITNGIDSIKMEEKYCVPLELEINLLKRDEEWIRIGDHLYYYTYPDANHPKPPPYLTVSDDYFKTIVSIVNKKSFAAN